MAYLLIADDAEDFASALARVLRDAGHEVEIALDTKDAEESMHQRVPDLLILDVMFPGDSSAGFELARTLRRCKEKLRDTPVLMLTAVNTKFSLQFSADDIDDQWLPVSDFLEKPADFDLLREKVSALLGERGPGES